MYDKNKIKATVVAHSTSKSTGKEIVTFELEYPRFIHGQLLMHRIFSRNAMSSRAVPVKTMIEQVRANPATPIHWGKNQAGMQAFEECSNNIDLGAAGVTFTAEEVWREAAKSAANYAEALASAGYHKQIVNRILEPFQMMKAVVTTTELDSFFWLRLEEDTQPEMCELAQCVNAALQASIPQVLDVDEWHTPYVHRDDCGRYYAFDSNDPSCESRVYLTSEEAIMVSASCCAQVSYRNIDVSLDKALRVYERLGVGTNKLHASPFEHQATPMEYPRHERYPEMAQEYSAWDLGETHVDKYGYAWSGNFKGWIQHRQLLKNHTK